MTYKNSQMAHEARILKAVSMVVGLFALTLAGLTIALAPSGARPVAFLVAASTFCVGVYMWVYASRPDFFTNDPRGVLGDELRTRYVAPAAAVATARRTRALPVSEHIYAWQEVRRVPSGERIWTPEYRRLVALQSLGLITAVVLVALVDVAAPLGLGASAGPVWFVAAGIVLAAGFALSHRVGLVDATNYSTTTMPALPDLGWTPVLIAGGKSTVVTSMPVVDRPAA
jgi:hypothetical protein